MAGGSRELQRFGDYVQLRSVGVEVAVGNADGATGVREFGARAMVGGEYGKRFAGPYGRLNSEFASQTGIYAAVGPPAASSDGRQRPRRIFQRCARIWPSELTYRWRVSGLIDAQMPCAVQNSDTDVSFAMAACILRRSRRPGAWRRISPPTGLDPF